MAAVACYIQTDHQGRELAEHGSALFPIACYADDLSLETVAWHWHDEMEAILVECGEILVSAGTEKYVLKPGEGFFINAGVLHAAWNADEKNGACRIRSVVFHPRLVGSSADSIFWHNYVQPILSEAFPKSVYLGGKELWHREVMRQIDAAWRSGVEEKPGYEIQVRYALSQLLFLLKDHGRPLKKKLSEKAIRDGERIKIMLQYIQENYGNEITVAQIAGSVMISESECLRCFRSMIRTTPIRYVKQLRIQRAEELLQETDLKVADIGAQCGFQEMSYFAKTFREMTGCTPSEYRQMNEKKEEGGRKV